MSDMTHGNGIVQYREESVADVVNNVPQRIEYFKSSRRPAKTAE